MLKKTPLHALHQQAGARLVDFGGWEMPIHYGSQVEEHHQVRNSAGMFDVSHMTVVDVEGADAQAFLRRLLANDVARLTTSGKALYTCMLNENGGVVDDLIVYYQSPERYRLVVNAATREKDLAWMSRQADSFSVQLEEQPQLAMIAVQGPEAVGQLCAVLPDLAEQLQAQPRFSAFVHLEWFLARTGYTGEDGYEIILPAEDAPGLWEQLEQAGVRPCGLGARDTLRLEAGMNLYGQDMDESTTPLESALAWTVAWEPADRDFIGRKALEKQKAEGVPRKLVGLVLLDRGVLRHGQVVQCATGQGEITSGSFSPTMGRSIAMARVPADCEAQPLVDVRGRKLRTTVVRMPFVRNGQVSEAVANTLKESTGE